MKFFENYRYNTIVNHLHDYIYYIVKENKRLKEEIKELEQEDEKLTELWLESQTKRRNGIKYIKENSYIVQDKEINGIPLMSKRLDKCDDLLEILGDKENE